MKLFSLDDKLLQSQLNQRIHSAVLEELALATEQLKVYGITLKAGLEIEFCPDAYSHNENPLTKEKRAKTVGLADELPLSRAERELFTRNVKNHTDAETMMWELASDPAITSLIEACFDAYGNPAPSYDSSRSLEIRTLPTSVLQQLKNFEQLAHRLDQLVAEYELPVIDHPHLHMSFSVWRNGRNLFDHRQNSSAESAPFVERIARVLFDGRLYIVNQTNYLRMDHSHLAASINREHRIRLANGRLEIRPADLGNGGQSPALMALLVSSAVLSTLRDDHVPNIVSAQHQQRGLFQSDAGQFKRIKQVLNGTFFETDGTLSLPKRHIKMHNVGIAVELGLISPRHGDEGSRISTDAVPLYMERMWQFFEATRWVKENDKITIIWPNIKGIETSALNKNLRCTDCITVPVILPGYPLTATNMQRDCLVRDLVDSPILRACLSQNFQNSLSEAIDDLMTAQRSFSGSQVTSNQELARISL